ncbi:MAG: secretin N-terminal domain-containing protein [Planctomycetota bacterium]
MISSRRIYVCLFVVSLVVATSGYAQPEEKPAKRLEVYRLKYAEATNAAVLLQGLLANQDKEAASKSDVRLSVDKRTNSLIVSAYKKDLEIVRSLIEVVDRPSQPSEMGSPAIVSRSIEVAWLTDGPEGKELPPMFDRIQAKLQQKGIRNLRMAAMTTTRVISSGEFNCGSSPKLGDRRIAFEVSGTLSKASKPQDVLSIQIEATEKKASGGPTHHLAQLRTDVSTVVGLPVVLAVAPLDDLTSVFVITVSEVE